MGAGGVFREEEASVVGEGAVEGVSQEGRLSWIAYSL